MTRQGWRGWDHAWQDALYGPAGFYRQTAPAEHFATSAQGLGGTGAVLAQALLRLAHRHGLGRIVEVGAGRGELLQHLARQSGAAGQPESITAAEPLALTGIDVVRRPEHLPPQVGWLSAPGGPGLPPELSDLSDTLLVAHEWLDVVPCPVAARDDTGTWRQVLVSSTGGEAPGPAVQGPELAWLRSHVPDPVARAEVGLARDAAYQDLCSRVRQGLVLAIDYGHTQDTRPVDGTLVGYRHGTVVPPTPDGSCDLTAHVAVDTLGAQSVTRQRQALHDLLGRPSLPPHELSGADPTAYLQHLSQSNALATLTRPGGLGDFWWVSTRCGPDALG